MLKECKALANDHIDAWVHAAAVLDYVVQSPAEGKLASQQGSLNLSLVESQKHIMELKKACASAVRIGFKLESGIKQKGPHPPGVCSNPESRNDGCRSEPSRGFGLIQQAPWLSCGPERCPFCFGING